MLHSEMFSSDPFFANLFHKTDNAMGSFSRTASLFNSSSFTFSSLNYQSGSLFSRYPTSNLVERNDFFEASLEIPGYDKQSISIEMSDGRTMVISGRQEARSPLTTNEDRMDISEEAQHFTFNSLWSSSERYSRSFSRTIAFPCPIKVGEIKASYKNGVLYVTVPKLKEYHSRQINID